MLATTSAAYLLLAAAYVSEFPSFISAAKPDCYNDVPNANRISFNESVIIPIISKKNHKAESSGNLDHVGIVFEDIVAISNHLTEHLVCKQQRDCTDEQAANAKCVKEFSQSRGVVLREFTFNSNGIASHEKFNILKDLRANSTAQIIFLPGKLHGLVDEPRKWYISWNFKKGRPRKIAKELDFEIKQSLGFRPCYVRDHQLTSKQKEQFFGLQDTDFMMNINKVNGRCYPTYNDMILDQNNGKCVPRKRADLHIAYVDKKKPQITLIHFKKVIALGSKCLYPNSE